MIEYAVREHFPDLSTELGPQSAMLETILRS